MEERTFHLLRLLLARLERISADSHWAHRASGVRGALLKNLQRFDDGLVVSPRQVEAQIRWGFEILEQAGRERIGRGATETHRRRA
ncbi:MAG: hypothetical protein HFACDABA_01281 [Anaerolineales bacterium]|nr:hypothetical protein [Anaerolineales bacterium]